MEDFLSNGFVFLQIRGLSKPLPKLVAALKPVMEESPIFFQTEHGVAGTAEGHHIFFQQSVHKARQRLDVRAAAERARIRDQAPSDHNGRKTGKLALQILCLGKGENISIVTQGLFDVFHSL